MLRQRRGWCLPLCVLVVLLSWVLATSVLGGRRTAVVAVVALQAQLPRIKVHLWDDGNIYKARELIYNQEGWSKHPRTMLVDTPESADLVVWITTMTKVEDELVPEAFPTVVLDYSDACNTHPKRSSLQNELGYFKRSWVMRDGEGAFTLLCTAYNTQETHFFPLMYSGAAPLVQSAAGFEKRPYAVVSTLRSDGYTNNNRKRVLGWTQAVAAKHQLGPDRAQVGGPISNGYSASRWDGPVATYLELLHKAQIIVTCNPGTWEGDFRLWESMLSGALVMVDATESMALLPFPLQDQQHYVVYNSSDRADFEDKLEYYLAHPAEAGRIAKAGWDFVLAHHLPEHRVDYILNTMPPLGGGKGSAVSAAHSHAA